MNSSLLSFVGALALAVVVGISAAIGFAYGREVGRCEVECAEATAGSGTASYLGGECRCLLDTGEMLP
jgi:hypothetical protein